MATDKSEPRVGIIVKVAGIAIVVFVGVRFGLVSYFNNIQDEIRAQQAAEAVNPELDQVRAREASLDKGPTPIAAAMQTLANTDRSRKGVQGLEPQQSNDMRAVTDCWAKMPCDGGGLALPATSASAAAATGDGGAGAATGDAGAAPATSGSAAPKNPPKQNPNPAPTKKPEPPDPRP